MRARGASGPLSPGNDRALWERSQGTEASPAETERFLDLAGFADGRLDEDERERVAAIVAVDPAAAADVAAARALTASVMSSVGEDVIARAVALADGVAPRGELVAFPRHRSPGLWRGAATWSSLAAALAIAGWFGFDLGSGLPDLAVGARSYDDAVANEFLDPGPLLLRDFSEGSAL